MQPNFLIIGAQKAGTTSVITYLSHHPEVFVPLDKEYSPYYADLCPTGSFENREELLYKNYNGQKQIGNAPVNLLYFAESSAYKIFTHAPRTKLIAILRNPIDRAYSAYCHFVSHGLEKKTFEDSLSAEENIAGKGTFTQRANFTYLRHGLYYDQLARFYQYFDKNQLLVLLHDDLRSALHQTLDTIFCFLGVEPLSAETVYAREHNVASRARLQFLGPLVFQDNLIKRLYKKVTPKTLRFHLKYSFVHPLLKRNRVPHKYPPMNTATREMLQRYFLEPNNKLQKLLDRDISHWNK